MWPRRRPKEKDSKIALETAIKNLEETRARASDVTETAKALRKLRERNHFAEQLASIMGGSK